MEVNFKNMIDTGVIELGKTSKLLCEGEIVWMGLSDDLYNISENYHFVKFINDKTNDSEYPCTYEIEVKDLSNTGNNLQFKTEVNKLTESYEDTMEYGVPEQQKFPLYDKQHVLSAIKYFNLCDKDHQEELAEAIAYKILIHNIPLEVINEGNNLANYLFESEDETESLEVNKEKKSKDEASDSKDNKEKESKEDKYSPNVKMHDDGDGKGKYIVTDSGKKVYPGDESLDEDGSSGFRQVYKHGGPKINDYFFEHAVGRVKDKELRDMLINQYKLERKGKHLNDRSASSIIQRYVDEAEDKFNVKRDKRISRDNEGRLGEERVKEPNKFAPKKEKTEDDKKTK